MQPNQNPFSLTRVIVATLVILIVAATIVSPLYLTGADLIVSGVFTQQATDAMQLIILAMLLYSPSRR